MGQDQTPLRCYVVLTISSVVIALLMVSVVSAETWYITPESQCVESPTNELCLTLSRVAANTQRYFADSITLILRPGDHILDSLFFIWSISNLEIFASFNATVTCSESGRFQIEWIPTVNIRNIVFIKCVENNVIGVNHFMLENCHFHDQRFTTTPYQFIVSGIGLSQVSLADIERSTFSSYNNSVAIGAALSCNNGNVNIVSCLFQNNIANYGSAILILQSNVKIENSVFRNNVAHQHGGAIHSLANNNNAVTIKNSIFTNNRAILGGAVYSTPVEGIGRSITIENSTFISNVAEFSGGAVYVESIRNITMIRTRVINSTAKSYGGAFCLQFSSFISSEFLEIENSQGGVGVVYALQTEVTILGTNSMSNNCGSFLFIGSNVTFQGHTDFLYSREHGCSHQTTEELQQGGAVTVFNSDIRFEGRASFTGNQADNGGAIFAFQSVLYMYGEITLLHNRALMSGGGIYAYQSELRLRGTNTISNNTADNVGGGIHAIGSTTALLQGALHFTSNHATRGGGMFLESNCKVYILKHTSESLTNKREHWQSINFNENSADYGGAIYVSDSTNSGVCASITTRLQSTATTECFLQTYTYSFNSADQINLQNIFFTSNSATFAGDSLYGGLLDRCTVNPLAEIPRILQIHPTNLTIDKTNGGIFTMSDIEEDAIASDPVRVCFCNRGKPDCSYQPDTVRVRKGERFVLPVVAVNQLGRSTPSRIHSSLQSQGGTFIEGQLLQSTSENCTELEYNILSPHDFEQLLLYAEGSCRDIGISQRFINVTFLPCDCPIGFERSNITQTNCSCICDSPIRSYIFNCSIETKSIVRQGNFWITYKNYSVLNKNGYVIYDYCPFDYCFPSTTLVNINLNIPDGSDAQCAFNRSGILCGSCQEGLSLSLGSSRCMPCSNHWLALLIPFVIAGIALVAFLLAFNLTVAIGTINGVIFYANVVAANRTLFFPFDQPNIVTIFIAWLNLDFGFETCFYDGMDGYVKVWLQLVFPLYIIFLVAMVIIISERIIIKENSWWITKSLHRLSSNTNPVAILATLILLSYAKLIRTIIVALSFVTLEYPDGSCQVVWRYDGKIPYLEGKHIPLFIAAFIILLIGLVYTFLLLFWQCLIRCKCPKNTKEKTGNRLVTKFHTNLISGYSRLYIGLNNFMDIYHAPYVTTHRYWTGLLLLARGVLYLITSINITGDPTVNLLATICVLGVLLLWKSTDKIYKNRVLNVLESSLIFNLLIFAANTLYLELRDINGNQAGLAYTSTSIALITFLGVLLYHLPWVIYTIGKTSGYRRFANYSNNSVKASLSYEFLENALHNVHAKCRKTKAEDNGGETVANSPVDTTVYERTHERTHELPTREVSVTSIDGCPDKAVDFTESVTL